MESRRAPEVAMRPGPEPRHRRHLLAPLWRLAPRRLLHDRLTLVVMVGVLTLVALSASAGPLYAEAVSDSAVRRVLDAVPQEAPAKAAPVVRLNGGIDPESKQWSDMLAGVGTIPGISMPRVTVQTISTELFPQVYYDPVGPVLTGSGAGAPVRLFGVDDPASRLVVVTRSPDAGRPQGVWIPEPVAATTGTEAGDEVRVQLSGLPESPVARTRVLGTYAVEADGRTPRAPAGEGLWAELGSEAFPSDAEQPTLRAHLAVADLESTAALARDTDDKLLWSARSRLTEDSPRLTAFHRTADAVSLLRRLLASRAELADDPVTLRPSIASGVEDLADRADELSDAARRGSAVTSAAGLVLALALVVAAAGFSMGRRRREVALSAGTGRRPASAGVLHLVELVPTAVVAGVVGWFAARGLVALAVGATTPTRSVLRSSALWCTGAMVAALVLAGTVAAVSTRLETRRLEGRADVHLPWVLVLVVVAVASTVGLLTRPVSTADTLGPLDLLVPPLVAAAVAAVGSRLFFALVRRGRSSGRPPTRRTVVTWLARRRLQAPDPGREVATTIAAAGLALLVFSLAALTSLAHTVDDRSAVAVGAHTVHRIGFSYQLDPTAPRQAAEPADGSPLALRDIPTARNPQLPQGQSTVWRTRTGIAGSDESVSLLVVDPVRFAEAADWGSRGSPVADGRAMLSTLAAEDAVAAGTTRRDGVAAVVPALLVGEVGDLGLEVGSTLTVDTLNVPVRVVVRGEVETFPGAGTGQATLVLPSDSFFTTQLNEDPRLRPGPDAPRNRPVEFDTQLWSSTTAGATRTLARYALAPDLVGTLAEQQAMPVYVAAEQARRYEVALGVVFGGVGLLAVVLAAIRRARRTPAADRMLEWAGVGRTTVGRARVLEVAVVLLLSGVLAVGAVLALRPLVHVLLEPGDQRSPQAVLVVPGSALLVAGAWVLLAAGAAVVGSALAARSQSTVEVLRGED